MRTPWSRWAELAGFTLAYTVVARLSILTLGKEGISLVWPAAGLSLGVLLLRGRWLWWGIVLGATAANLLGGFSASLAVALGLINGLETLLAATLLLRVAGFSQALNRLKDIISLAVVSMGATTVGALLAAVAFWGLDTGTSNPWQVAGTWWKADQVSIWLLTPVMLVLARSRLIRQTREEWLLFLGCCAVVVSLGWLLFLQPFSGEWFSLPFITFPLLVVIALRFGPFGSALSNLLLGSLALAGTLRGQGVLVTLQNPYGVLQTYLGAALFTSLILSIFTEERRRNASLVLETEQWLQTTLLAVRAAIWEWDARQERMIRFSNDDVLLGEPMPASGWSSERFLRYVHTEDRVRVAEEFRRAVREGSRYEVEFRVARPDGSTRWLVSRATPRMRGGQCVGLGGVLLDITQRKHQEQALAESEHRFELMADTAPVLLWMSVPGKGCTYFNQPWCQFTGCTLEQQLGQGWTGAVHPEDLPRLLEIRRVAAAAREPFEVEYRLRHHEGDYHWLLEHAAPRLAGDSLLGYIGACADIQRLKTAEGLLQERSHHLERLNQELARSNADLEQFAHVTSHDLREPIRMVSSYGELLERRYGEQLDERARKYLGYIVEGGLRLQELVNDLLVYSRAGRAGQLPVATPLAQVLQRVQVSLHQALAESGARLSYDTLPTVRSFPSQMEVLFQNLIENAIKFRRAVPPEIFVSVHEGGPFWEFEVRDNGIGIEPQYLERIFGLFQRLHSREQYPGTGMGLAICKRIVERHGGTIWATSRPGEGTAIHFTLPRELTAEAPLEAFA